MNFEKDQNIIVTICILKDAYILNVDEAIEKSKPQDGNPLQPHLSLDKSTSLSEEPADSGRKFFLSNFWWNLIFCSKTIVEKYKGWLFFFQTSMNLFYFTILRWNLQNKLHCPKNRLLFTNGSLKNHVQWQKHLSSLLVPSCRSTFVTIFNVPSSQILAQKLFEPLPHCKWNLQLLKKCHFQYSDFDAFEHSQLCKTLVERKTSVLVYIAMM